MSHAGPVRCACVVDHAPEPIDVEIHHVVPLAWGGPDVAANRVNLCVASETPVLMGDGSQRPIAFVASGDYVVGPDLLAHRVTTHVVSSYSGWLVAMDGLRVTPSHRLLSPLGWMPAWAWLDHASRQKVIQESVEPHVLALVMADPEVASPVVVRGAVDVVDDLAASGHPSNETCAFDGASLIPFPEDEDDVTLTVSRPSAFALLRSRNLLQRSEATVVPAVAHDLALVGAPLESGAASVAGELETRPLLKRRTAFGRAVEVTPGQGAGTKEVGRAHSAGLDDHRHALGFEAGWDAALQASLVRYNGLVHDLTVADAAAFIAGNVVVHNCGNAHNNVHALLRAYQRAGGTPPWDVRRRFSPYIRALAARGWAERPIERTMP